MGYVELYLSVARPFFRREVWFPKRGSPKRYRVGFKTGMCCADAPSQRARDNKPLLVFLAEITARALSFVSSQSAGEFVNALAPMSKETGPDLHNRGHIDFKSKTHNVSSLLERIGKTLIDLIVRRNRTTNRSPGAGNEPAPSMLAILVFRECSLVKTSTSRYYFSGKFRNAYYSKLNESGSGSIKHMWFGLTAA
jgi:hypothetical protein